MNKRQKLVIMGGCCLLLVIICLLLLRVMKIDEKNSEDEENLVEEVFDEETTLEETQEHVIDMETLIVSPNDFAEIIGSPEVKKESIDSFNEEDKVGLIFPYKIPDTDLVIENVVSYDGLFLENGSDIKASGIFAIIVRNVGEKNVEYMNIQLKNQDKTLQFIGSTVQAGAAVLIQASNSETYSSEQFNSCTVDVAYQDVFEMSESEVLVTETDDGSLLVENISGEDLPYIRIFYKFYMADEDIYVGGITYTAKLTNLTKETKQHITPSHYVAGSSKIVMVKTYEKEE